VSRHMGLFAVARLAERHGVRVRLRPRSPHGLTALIWLPESITEREAGLYGARVRTFAAQSGGFQGRATPSGSHAARSVPDALPANNHHEVVVPDHPATAPRETQPISGPAASTGPVVARAATSDWFRSRPSGAAAGNGNGSAAGAAGAATQPSGPQDGRGAGGTDGWAVGRHAAQIVAEPVRGDFTSAGLPTRVPRANLIPGSAGGGRSAAGAPSRPGSGPEGQTPITPRSPRSPDVARSRLSGFQRGGRRAKGATPDDGEGADR